MISTNLVTRVTIVGRERIALSSTVSKTAILSVELTTRWESWIRTTINYFRNNRPTIRRIPNAWRYGFEPQLERSKLSFLPLEDLQIF